MHKSEMEVKTKTKMEGRHLLANNNQFHNILRLSNVLPNFHFATSETMADYYLQTWYILVASRVAERLKT